MLFYQPLISLAQDKVVGAEALLRWRNDEGDFVPPEKFIPVAEYSGLILTIGEWVLRKAANQLRMWNDAGLSDFRVAVNVSMAQFRVHGFTDVVRSVIEEFGLNPAMLELEITESMAMEEIETAMDTLCRLKEIGVAVAIDDFGTGFSSLGYLQQLSVDRLKIDRRFVNELTHGSRRASIPEMIVKLGHNLGLQVIGEGVETQEHARALAALGCDEGQGYLYSVPSDISTFERWLGSRGVLRTPATSPQVAAMGS
jgi:EAL domain-containing protein (putative c-di-GMP-specific phosphodiesterase class I)